MRRFLTLVILFCLAVPAGISIVGCTRNPAAKYCPATSGYGIPITAVTQIILQPEVAGISLAYGQTTQVQSPSALTCLGTGAVVSSKDYTYGTQNNQLVDISPSGAICAGTWNRNTGGGILDYTICNLPDPLPSTGGLPYAVTYITASASSVTSNPVAVYVHAPVTSVALATPSTGTGTATQQCTSQGDVVQLDAQACFASGASGSKQVALCAPASVTQANSACPWPAITPDIIASGTFISVPSTGNLVAGSYTSGGTITGLEGQTCTLSGFNGGSNGASATVELTAANTIASGTALVITAGGSSATAAPTTATLSNGTATCSGTATISTALGPIAGSAGQTCTLTNFNNGSTGATASVTLTGANTIASGTGLVITAGGLNATAPPTTAVLSNGTATCAGTATVTTTMTPVPTCESSIGTMTFTLGTSTVASINSTTNQITAEQPGTTVITASIAGSGSSAGYFSTCPPASISMTLANGSTSGIVAQGAAQNLTTTVLDTNGNQITGLNLTYQSTNPIDVSVSGGSIATSFPGTASLNAICQPAICNPAPINEIGLNGTGLSISSNPVTVTVPGSASQFAWFSSPGQSQYFVPIELLTGTVGSSVKLPYVPNSMVMDRTGSDLYFGSPRELMVYSTSSDALTKQDPTAPGVVLAVSPNNSQLLINDQARQLFYLYNASAGGFTTFGGMGAAAAWTPDADTLYIVDNAELNTPSTCSTPLITGHTDTLYVYNVNTGWSTYPLPPSPLPDQARPSCSTQPNSVMPLTAQMPAIMVPGVGAYMRGVPTTAHTWCPSGTVGNNSTIQYYPLGDTEAVQSDVLGATVDGKHILSATATGGGGIALNDIAVTIPATTQSNSTLTPDMCPSSTDSTTGTETLGALTINSSVTQAPVSGVDAGEVNQVVVGSVPQVTASQTVSSNLAFITYSAPSSAAPTTNAQLPYYIPAAGSAPGSLNYVTLNDCSSCGVITAPLVGTFSPDNTIFFVSTAGDNEIHYITIPSSVNASTPPADKQQISPNLPACTPVASGGVDAGCTYTGTGTIVPATAIAVKPRSTT